MKKSSRIYFLIHSLLYLFLLVSCESSAQQEVVSSADELFENVNQLIVKGSFCNVTVIAKEQNVISFTGEIKADADSNEIAIKYEQKGDQLEVWIERPNNVRNVSGFLSFEVPKSITLTIDNSSGSVSVAGVSSSNEFNIETSSGSIRLDKLEGNLNIDASSGSVRASNIKGNIVCETSSGSQKYSDVIGSVTLDASSGSITCTNVIGAYVAETSSGSHHIESIVGGVVCEASSGRVELLNVTGAVTGKTSSGSIKLKSVNGVVNLESSSGGQSGDEVTLTGSSKFKSSSGSIVMSLTNSKESLSFDLSSSSGKLEAKGISGHKKLTFTGGDILIEGKSTSGKQTYK